MGKEMSMKMVACNEFYSLSTSKPRSKGVTLKVHTMSEIGTQFPCESFGVCKLQLMDSCSPRGAASTNQLKSRMKITDAKVIRF